MYKIIGADQREYGPVTAEQVREWVAQGRANGDTLVQPEGATDWRPLSSFPEFSDILGGAVPGTPPPPPPGDAGATPVFPEPVRRPASLDIGSCVTRSWMLFRENIGLLIGATVLWVVLVLIVSQVIGLFTRGLTQSLVQGNFDAGVIIGLLLWNIPEMALSGIFMGGYYILLLKLVRGAPAGIGDLFAGFGPAALQLALAGVVVQLLTIVGMLACIVPGVYLSVAWIMAMPLIVDRRMDFWSAMEFSRKTVTRQWWMMFCLVLLMALFSIVGLAACCVGVLVAMPVSLGALIYAYEDLFSGTTTTTGF